jgi:hypothetical protein
MVLKAPFQFVDGTWPIGHVLHTLVIQHLHAALMGPLKTAPALHACILAHAHMYMHAVMYMLHMTRMQKIAGNAGTEASVW